ATAARVLLDQFHLFLGEFGARMQLTRGVSGDATVSCPDTLHIFGMRYSLDVLWIAADWIAAQMVRFEALRHRTVPDFPHRSRGQDVTPLPIDFVADSSVAFMSAGQPRPAFVFTPNVNLAPEAGCERLHGAIVVAHTQSAVK